MNLNLKVFVFAVVACLLMSFDGTKAWSQGVHKGEVVIPMSGTGVRPHSMTNAQATASAIRNQNKYEYNLTAVCHYSKARFLLDHINRGIVMISGYATPTTDGHAWVADGGLRVGTVRTHVDYGMGLDGSDVVTVTENLEMLVHFNWGWGGYGNGYFNPEVFNPTQAESYDYQPSSTNMDFKYNIDYIAFYKD